MGWSVTQFLGAEVRFDVIKVVVLNVVLPELLFIVLLFLFCTLVSLLLVGELLNRSFQQPEVLGGEELGLGSLLGFGGSSLGKESVAG